MEQDSHAHFLPTHWTLIEALKAPDQTVRTAAMAELARQYWPPVYAHLRRSGRTREQAAELTQGFFADVVLTRQLFERAEPNSFRLRTFLLHALSNYLVDDHRRQASSNRPNLAIPLELIKDEETFQAQWRDQAAVDPADEFHRRWALVVLQEALSRCEQHFKAGDRQKHWALFEARVVQPMFSGSQQATIADLASTLGFRSYTDAIVSLRSTRKKLTTVFIPQVLAETNSKPEDQHDEFQVMLSLLP